MSDDLKFRVWCCDRNEWERDECTLHPDGNVIHFTSQGIPTLLRANSHIVERCVGIADRSHNLFYTGDIVEVEMMCDNTSDVTEGFSRVEEHEDGAVYRFTRIRGVVEWRNTGFFIKLIERTTNFGADFYDYMGDKFSWQQLEIVGNIHENPEFL